MTNRKQDDLDALIESTMPSANDVKRQPVPELPVALKIAEQALAETSKPIKSPAPITPMVWPTSERDEIRQRVSNFKAHQEKMAHEREDYYSQMQAKMLAHVHNADIEISEGSEPPPRGAPLRN